MFKGELTRVKILAHNEIINVIVDKFGEKVRMQKHDDDHVVITADVQISPTFYAWCFTFGSKLKILSPEKVIDELKRRALEAVKTYS